MTRTYTIRSRGPRVLVIDEDCAMRRLLRRELEAEGYRVREGEPGEPAARTIAERKYDLLIFDIDCHAGGGTEAIQIVRRRSSIPILALSVSNDEAVAAGALYKGADDYVRKPFGSKELLARVRNALRRRAQQKGKPVELVFGDLEIDLLRRRVRSKGQDVHIALKPYEVLRLLAEDAGTPLTHETILNAVWGPKQHRKDYLRIAIRDLRRSLELDAAHPCHIITERGIGYRLEAEGRDLAPHASPCQPQGND